MGNLRAPATLISSDTAPSGMEFNRPHDELIDRFERFSSVPRNLRLATRRLKGPEPRLTNPLRTNGRARYRQRPTRPRPKPIASSQPSASPERSTLRQHTPVRECLPLSSINPYTSKHSRIASAPITMEWRSIGLSPAVADPRGQIGSRGHRLHLAG